MKTMAKIYTALVFIFLYAPIAVLILFSFNSTNSTGVFEGFSLYWYKELFSNSGALNALKNTLILATLSAVIATVIGTAAATGIVKFRRKAIKNTVLSVTNIPMMNPDIVTGISLMLLFVFIGRLIGIQTSYLNFWTLLIAHVTFNIPYVILNVMPKFSQMDVHLPEAAMDLGCTPVKVMTKVILPLSASGIISGVTMVLVPSISTFYISQKLGGGTFELIGDTIERQFVTGALNTGAALSLVMMILILLSLAVMNRFTDSDEGGIIV